MFMRLGIHKYYLTALFLFSLLVYSTPYIVTGIPLTFQLSSDAELHVAHWRDLSETEFGIFKSDTMFQKDTRPAAELAVDSLIVRTGERIGIDVLTLSILISIVASIIFLSGVYAVVLYSTSDAFLAFLVSLGSVIPAFVLGGFYWGFMTLGFLPRELALSLAVWLLLFNFISIRRNKIFIRTAVFIGAGFLANWYPVLFFHFILVLFGAEIIREKKLTLRNLMHLALFFVSAFFALYDTVLKSGNVSTPDGDALHFRFGYMLLSSWQYALLRYLRRFILYGILVGVCAFLAKRFFNQEHKNFLGEWYALLISSAVFSGIGLFLENNTLYTKFLFSRSSVWFTFAAMVIVAWFVSEYVKKFFHIRYTKIVIFFIVYGVFILQSAIPTLYRDLKYISQNVDEYRSSIEFLQKLPSVVPFSELVLADPKTANQIRAYGSRGTYVSWKEGGIALLDGVGGKEWLLRLQETSALFGARDGEKIIDFALERGLSYVIFDTNAIKYNDQKKRTGYSYIGVKYIIKNFKVIEAL